MNGKGLARASVTNLLLNIFVLAWSIAPGAACLLVLLLVAQSIKNSVVTEAMFLPATQRKHLSICHCDPPLFTTSVPCWCCTRKTERLGFRGTFPQPWGWG